MPTASAAVPLPPDLRMPRMEPDAGTGDQQVQVRMLYGLVHPTCHNPNTPSSAFPLVSGPVVRLPGHHAKARRGGYRKT